MKLSTIVRSFSLAVTAITLVATVTVVMTAHAQQVPIPTTAADVPGPAPGTAMTKPYVEAVGRMAY
jgi:hypothetical protein